jgi:hypothetical protein
VSKKERNKHKYSTYLLFILSMVVLTGAVIAAPFNGPGGVSGSVQFNDNGTLNGSSDFTYNKNTAEVTLGGLYVDLPSTAFINFTYLDEFAGAYIQPVLNAKDNFGIGSFTMYDNLFLKDSGVGSGGAQIYLQENATSYAIINMEGKELDFQGTYDKLTFRGVETNLAGTLTVGTNTNDNLSTGDINASTIYYDTLTAKSPTFLCDSGTNWCQITVPQYQKSLYAKFSQDWDIEQVNFDGVEYTPQQFVQQVCPTNAKTQSTCDEIIEKYQKMKAKRTADIQLKNNRDSCESLGGQFSNNECVGTVTTTVTYSQAVEAYNYNIYNYKLETVTELNNNLEIIMVQRSVKDSIVATETRYRFKGGCSWNGANNYICVSQEVINI